ncbi:hypothetical protein MWU49_12995 [Alcanivorax sp. S6407]|uniref:hypothetical protein n=1 Tax=Alcanivorax sp. S6407 TaxID=2926424 RepID=UPI001FF462A2|nr:hypothetical protein [Alcanivorax sp. S6407]MCK0154629.1 hypothetical protein [Alcanivorax sp. S6407]
MKKLVLVLALAVSAPLWARSGKLASEVMPQGAYFRHVTPDGVVHLNRTLRIEAIQNGYQLLDAQGRVLEEVEGVELNNEEARKQRMEDARQAREDKELLRLYAGPEDAVRARDRKIDALELSISYEENNLAQLQMKLDDEIAVAARSERAGKKVPAGVQEAIDRLKRQIATSEKKLADFDQEIDDANKEYSPIIKRLTEIEQGK